MDRDRKPTMEEITDITYFAKNLGSLRDEKTQDIVVATANGIVEGIKLSMMMKGAGDGV